MIKERGHLRRTNNLLARVAPMLEVAVPPIEAALKPIGQRRVPQRLNASGFKYGTPQPVAIAPGKRCYFHSQSKILPSMLFSLGRW